MGIGGLFQCFRSFCAIRKLASLLRRMKCLLCLGLALMGRFFRSLQGLFLRGKGFCTMKRQEASLGLFGICQLFFWRILRRTCVGQGFLLWVIQFQRVRSLGCGRKRLFQGGLVEVRRECIGVRLFLGFERLQRVRRARITGIFRLLLVP